jgi:hypothetical protein
MYIGIEEAPTSAPQSLLLPHFEAGIPRASWLQVKRSNSGSVTVRYQADRVNDIFGGIDFRSIVASSSSFLEPVAFTSII